MLSLLTGLAISATTVNGSALQQKPTFRSSVDVVTVAAVVRDRHGHFASDLTKKDFVIEESGLPRPIVEFHSDENAPLRVALLFDVSGSMRLSEHMDEAHRAADQVLGTLHLENGGDEAAVFSFDMNLQELQPFTSDPGAIDNALSRVMPYGETSLYDAIAETAHEVADTADRRRRRAIVVFTDGIDTSSELTPTRVSEIASAIDVPVYVVAVVAPTEYQDQTAGRHTPLPAGTLRDLAHWTGGELFVTSAPAHQSLAARQIVDELRHEYVLAFNASDARGWHPVDVKVKDRSLTVRARTGYDVSPGDRRGMSPMVDR
ncbi:MAG: VWA domain-containing protein [Vicinamibacterales bacterium]